MIGIYKITNPSGKTYIGQSIDIERRIKSHKNLNNNKCVLVYNSLKKYGIENHIFEVIEECTIDQLNEREIYWALYYNALHPNGLVLKAGGEPSGKGFMSEQTRCKMSKSKLGKKDSNETKIKKSDSAKGKNKTTNHKNNISNSHHKKAVEKYDINGLKLEEYISINEASRKENIRAGDISANCNGIRKTVYGFIWKFKDINLRPIIKERKKRILTLVGKEILSNKMKGNKYKEGKGKPILQYDLEGNFIKEWLGGATQVEKILGFNHKAIQNNLKSITKTSNKYIWKYKFL